MNEIIHGNTGMDRSRAKVVVHDAQHTIIVVESVSCWHHSTGSSYQAAGRIEPIAIIICSQEGIDAMDMEASPIDLTHLCHAVPQLASTIAAYNMKLATANPAELS